MSRHFAADDDQLLCGFVDGDIVENPIVGDDLGELLRHVRELENLLSSVIGGASLVLELVCQHHEEREVCVVQHLEFLDVFEGALADPLEHVGKAVDFDDGLVFVILVEVVGDGVEILAEDKKLVDGELVLQGQKGVFLERGEVETLNGGGGGLEEELLHVF